ncbi:GlxA family transcriptional regulator [Micromonospora sp. KC721]|uniref:GlxA family transcriptional regulator n=1 Tax=Micromonospora sp. KC721 TaxID=2530380 RepID=UPI00104B55A4|nr:DJ-1/PfpI family protein [Micromonospora sp. KC721]TDB82321.1 helix-turn-helix domain-containing protein [Micromonospora sp. KC721]
MPKVVFLLVPDVHLLEIAAPAQVFSVAADIGLAYTLSYVSEQPTVATVQGVALTADTQWPDLDREDLLIVPGWRGPTRMIDTATTERLRAHHAAGGTVASVCAGADTLGRAGLLDGRRCTTHHTIQEELARRYPAATVVRDVLYVSDDRVVTCAGAASATDLALHLLSTRHGPSAASTVARTLVAHSWRDGTDDQESPVLRYRSHLDEAVHRVQNLIDSRFAERLPLRVLAAEAGCSPRTVTRQFQQATGITPLAYQQSLRVQRAEHLMQRGATAEAAARHVGFVDGRMLRRLRSRATQEDDNR